MNVDKWIDKKLREGAHIKGRKQSAPSKIEWKETTCVSCGHRIKYASKEGWNRKIKCPNCGAVFIVPNLDRYLK